MGGISCAVECGKQGGPPPGTERQVVDRKETRLQDLEVERHCRVTVDARGVANIDVPVRGCTHLYQLTHRDDQPGLLFQLSAKCLFGFLMPWEESAWHLPRLPFAESVTQEEHALLVIEDD